eukprot:2604049-Amphidinium_carterae.1
MQYGKRVSIILLSSLAGLLPMKKQYFSPPVMISGLLTSLSGFLISTCEVESGQGVSSSPKWAHQHPCSNCAVCCDSKAALVQWACVLCQ